MPAAHDFAGLLEASDLQRFFHPVLPASGLGRKPVQVLVGGRPYVLFRDASGRPAALPDGCPHRGARLSQGTVRPDGRLACAYHGWHFDAQGQGLSPSQPELVVRTACLRVEERLGHLWLGGPSASTDLLPDPRTQAAEGFESSGTISMVFPAPLHVALDNFSEDEHFPWVHTRLGWDESRAASVEYQCQRLADRTEISYRGVQRPSWLVPLLLLRNGDLFHNQWVMRFDPVRAEFTLGWRAEAGQERPLTLRALIYFVPETATTTRLDVFLFLRLNDPRFRPLMPLVRQASKLLGWLEVRDDARFIAQVAHMPFDLTGLRLGRFDAPLPHNHRLLRQIYLGVPAVEEAVRPFPRVQPDGP